MRKTLLSAAAAAILLCGCATTGSDRDYVVKVNGVETNNPEHTSSDIFRNIAIAGVVAGIAYVGIRGLTHSDSLTQEQLDQQERARQATEACAHLLPDNKAFDECRASFGVT